MKDIPFYVPFAFFISVVATAWFFYRATYGSIKIICLFVAWMLLQSVIAITGFYTVTTSMPPRFIFLVLPPLITIIILFSTAKGRRFVDGLNSKQLVWLHTVRIPVELVLYWLFVGKQVPQLVTFEGSNFDILSGITAAPVAWFGYHKKAFPRWLLLLWNFICLLLLLNVVVHAILSAPFPFQVFGFDQPMLAVLYFPYVLLPGFIVPLVLLSHLVCIRQLIIKP